MVGTKNTVTGFIARTPCYPDTHHRCQRGCRPQRQAKPHGEERCNSQKATPTGLDILPDVLPSVPHVWGVSTASTESVPYREDTSFRPLPQPVEEIT